MVTIGKWWEVPASQGPAPAGRILQVRESTSLPSPKGLLLLVQPIISVARRPMDDTLTKAMSLEMWGKEKGK